MDRRAAGVVLLFAALVVALVVPNAVGKTIAGTPVPELIAPPPTVGTCVTAIDQTSPAAQGAGANALPVAEAAPSCTGKVMGEIISVEPGTRLTVSTLDEFDQAHPSCRGQVEKYLGTTPTTTIDGVAWTKSLDVEAVTVGPDAHDRAAGRTWTACVLTAAHQTYRAGSSLRSSWTANTLPDAFGVCWAETVVQRARPTACTAPHRTQQFGYGFVASASDSGTSIVSEAGPAAMATGCEALAASVMKTADPSKGGRLAVAVVGQAAGAPYAACVVTVVGSGQLTHSLIGIGSKDLPLS